MERSADRRLSEFGDFPLFTQERAYFEMLRKSRDIKREIREAGCFKVDRKLTEW